MGLKDENLPQTKNSEPQREFPFTRAKGARPQFKRPPDSTPDRAKNAHQVRGLDFFLIVVLHELGHALANILCGRTCSIQVEEWGYGYTCFNRKHTLIPADEVFVAALGGSLHLAYLGRLSVPDFTKAFRERYVFSAIKVDAKISRANLEAFYILVKDEILPRFSDSFIAKLAQFAEAIAEDCDRRPDLCHYDITDDAEMLMPDVFEVLRQVREAINVLGQDRSRD